MSVLLVNNCPGYTGIGRYTDWLHSAMRGMDYDIDSMSWDSKFIRDMYAKSRNSFWLSELHVPFRIMSQLRFIKSIPRKYDLYHIASPSLGIASFKVKPFVITLHDMIPFTRSRDPADFLLRRSMSRLTKARRIICVSTYVKDELLRFFDVDPGLIRIVFNGVDHSLFANLDKANARRKLGFDDDKTLVLHVGTEEEPKKNIPTLIRAFHKFQQEVPDSLLIRVGESTDAAQRVIKSLGLQDKVRYFFAPTGEIANYYAAADMLVFTSTGEGFGLPPLEAMAAGCPVISSNSTSLPEIVGDAGILLEAMDYEAFGEAMLGVHHDSRLRAELIEKGYRHSGQFSWERCARETWSVYEEALRDG